MTSANVLALLGGAPVRTRPFQAWPQFDREEFGALSDVLESRRWGGIHNGSQGESFESTLARYLGAPHVSTVSSGTAALMIALRALGIGPGDEVVVPALTYVATATAVSLAGAVPVFADIDPDTHTLSSSSLKAALSERTKAVICVHLGGHPADMDSLGTVAAAHGIPLIEDCAQSLGASWNGIKTGALGTIATFSFATTKNITAGEGGAVVTHDAGLATRIASLRDHGRPPGSPHGHHELGWNLRLSEFQSALLRVQLGRLDQQLAAKEKSAVYLSSSLSGIPGLRLIPPPAAIDPRVTAHARFSFAFTLDIDTADDSVGTISPDTFRRALRAEGIPVSVRTLTACPDEPLYADPTSCDHSPSQTSAAAQARTACASLILLGQAAGSGMLLDHPTELADVVRAVEKIYDNSHHLRQHPPNPPASTAH
ncbi:DegT/DnrJ/EryC1/StrS family aminotransferase [Streptomyces sp. NPDC056949]|uniref:DegT/DnrJ/EryC1/StrS family aminotransferase n=1 Tax=Streptomyces sp. NPDC056949 TaxID=3345976 RepID=UPI003630138F